jgi:hypothetical protein
LREKALNSGLFKRKLANARISIISSAFKLKAIFSLVRIILLFKRFSTFAGSPSFLPRRSLMKPFKKAAKVVSGQFT